MRLPSRRACAEAGARQRDSCAGRRMEIARGRSTGASRICAGRWRLSRTMSSRGSPWPEEVERSGQADADAEAVTLLDELPRWRPTTSRSSSTRAPCGASDESRRVRDTVARRAARPHTMAWRRRRPRAARARRRQAAVDRGAARRRAPHHVTAQRPGTGDRVLGESFRR